MAANSKQSPTRGIVLRSISSFAVLVLISVWLTFPTMFNLPREYSLESHQAAKETMLPNLDNETILPRVNNQTMLTNLDSKTMLPAIPADPVKWPARPQNYFANTSSLPDLLSQHLRSTLNGDPKHPLFWHIPKSGGSTMKQFFYCMKFIGADLLPGANTSTGVPLTLDVVTSGKRQFVNGDVASVDGIKHASHLGLADNHMEDMIATPFIRESAEYLFNDNNPGSAFAVFRHPVDRGASLFYYLGRAHWEETYNAALLNISLLEYYQEGQVEQNWMVRQLVGRLEGSINSSDLVEAKQIVSEKILVGLVDQFDESVRRFGVFFGWENLPKWKECSEHTHSKVNSNAHDRIVPGGPEWQAILQANQYDVELYLHAVHVFHTQSRLFAAMDS